MSDKYTKSEGDEILQEAKKRFDNALDYFNTFRSQATEDLRFFNGDQWEPNAEQMRRSSGLPVVTVNKIKPICAQIINQIRKNKQAIQVDPVGGGASQDTAKVLSGLIRNIELDSGANAVYNTAATYAVTTGLGFIRIMSEYENEEISDEQKLLIKPVPDPNQVLFDPASVEIDGSDSNYCFIMETMSHEEFKRTFPDSKISCEVAASRSWSGVIDHNWIKDDSIQVVEYYHKTYTREDRWDVLNLMTGNREVLSEEPVDSDVLKVLGKRKVTIPRVHWCRFNGHEILESIDLPGRFIPVVPVYGDVIFMNGKKHISGMIKDAKGAQRVFNYFRSIQAEVVQMAPRAPWVGEVSQVTKFIKDWTNANSAPTAILRYEAVEKNGTLLPPPSRTSISTDINAITATCATAAEDLKSITGMYDPSLGADSSEVSGTAILARQTQTDNANSHYADNLMKSITHVGKILVDLIPFYYDTPRMVRIIKPNDDQEMIAINQFDGGIDLTIGRYDVVVQTGMSYASQRKEAVQAGLTLLQQRPEAFNLIGDLVVGNMDWAGAKTMAQRLKTQVPQEALEASGEMTNEDAAARLAALSAQTKQMMMQFEAMKKELEITKQELKIAHEENALIKMDKTVDLQKVRADYEIKLRALALEEQQTIAETALKEQDLVLRQKALEIQQQNTAIKGVATAHTVSQDVLKAEREQVELIDKLMNGDSSEALGAVVELPELDVNPGDYEVGSNMDATLHMSKPRSSPPVPKG